MSDFGLNPTDAPAKSALAVDMIDKIKVRTPTQQRRTAIQEIDAAAAQTGFTSREPYIKSTMRTPTRNEQTQQLAMRPYVSIVARFHKYAKLNGLSMPMALERLLDESEELTALRANNS
jgi:hypothetical protein